MLLNIEKCLFSISTRMLRSYPRTVKSSRAPVYEINNKNEEHCIDQNTDFPYIRRDSAKCSRIAIIGLPNVGKSTLVNRLINRSVCAVASRVHVTRVKNDAVYVKNNTQLIFIDTPGLVSPHEIKKFELEESFRKDARNAMESADVVGVVQDVSNKYTRGVIHKNILDLVKMAPVGVPTILIMNKVDKMKQKRNLLSLVKSLTSEDHWPNFSDVFMVSALTSDGVDDLRNYFLDSAKVRDWEYPPDIVTDQHPEELIQRVVRANLLEALHHEIPYQLKFEMEHFHICDDGSITSIVLVECKSESIMKIIIGRKVDRLKTVAIQSEQQLSNAFQTQVRLKIAVHVKS